MTRSDVLASVKTKIEAIGLPTLKKEIGKAFFNMDNVVEALYYALTSGLNIVLYGPGGFGKSEIVKEFIRIADLSSSTIIGFEDMEVDGLLGVVNIKKLTEESIYEINFENSVFRNPGVLILEEFLDARPSTAAALKDILSEGGYRRGASFIESLISSVIICTNTAPDDKSTNNSTSAFYKERFPIVVNVTWDQYDYNAYFSYLRHIFPKTLTNEKEEEAIRVVSELCAHTCTTKGIVSPRIAKHAMNLVLSTHSYNALRYLDGIDSSIIDESIANCNAKEERRKLRNLNTNISNKLSLIESVETYTVVGLNDALAELSYIKSKLTTLSARDPEDFKMIGELLSRCSNTYDGLSKKLTSVLSTEKQAALDYLFTLQ